MLASAYAQALTFIQAYGIYVLVAALLVVGFYRILARRLTAQRRARLARAFRDNFHGFCGSSGEDVGAYEWLAFHSERLGRTMGAHGAINGKPPIASDPKKSYASVLDYIPEMRMHYSSLRHGTYGLGNEGASWIYHNVDDALIRFLGALDEIATAAKWKLVNPVEWFREGVERVLALPFYLIAWFGLMARASAADVERHTFFRALASVVAIVVFIGAVMSALLGQNQAWAAIRALLGG